MASILKFLGQEYIDISFRNSKEYLTRIIERPGRWMSDGDIDKISTDLRTIAEKTLPVGELNYGVFAADRQRLSDSILTIIYNRKDNAPVAFNALAVMDIETSGESIEIIHLGLVMIDPDVRSRGLSWILYGLTCVVLFMRNGLRPILISNVTQVPAVVGMVSQTFSNVYPRPGDGPPRDFRKIQIARSILADHRYVFGVGEEAEFDETRFIIKNAYTGGSDELKKTFDEAPKHRDEAFNKFCKTSLDYDRGDDFLQIGLIDLNAARNYVARMVPPRSIPGFLALNLILMLQRIILPIIYWFDDKKPYGPLRSRNS